MHVRATRFALAAACLLPTTVTVFADVSYREVVTLSGRAALAAGGTAQLDVGVSGDRLRADVECLSGFLCEGLEKLGALRPAEIVRLDEGQLYGIEPGARTVYVETMAERKARLSRIDAKRDAAWKFDEVSVDIGSTGGHQTIAGFPCEQTMIMIIGTLKDPNSEASRRMLLRGDLWLTPSFEGKSELENFRGAYAEGLGADPEAALQSLFVEDRYAGILAEFAGALRKVGGFPIRTTLTISELASQTPTLPGAAPASTPINGAFSAPGAPGTPGLVAPRKSVRFRQRTDVSAGRGGEPLAMGPEWTLTRQISTLSTEPLPRPRFDPPEGFRRLVPRSGSHREGDAAGGNDDSVNPEETDGAAMEPGPVTEPGTAGSQG